MSIMYFSYGDNVIIDDIIFPDGRVKTGQLGGGSMYAVLGMSIWSQHLGVVTGIGNDCFKRCQEYLEYNDIDTKGLLVRDLPTPHAQQVYEGNEQRTEIFCTSLEEFVQMLPTTSEIPFHYHSAIGIHTFDFGDVELVKDLRRHFPEVTIAWEPYLPPSKKVIDREAIFDTLAHVDAFLPNYSEASRLCETQDINRIVNELLETGVKTVAVRMGNQGSIVSTRKRGIQHIPIYPIQIVDVTGAGNAYSGAFLVEYARSGDPLNAGIYGTVAASFTIEQVGLPTITPDIVQKAQTRYRWLQNHVGHDINGG